MKMTEMMYDELMAHIDNLEVWGILHTTTAATIRKYIKQDEGFAIMVYNYYFSTEIPNAYYR